jgi:hypothetical protein
MAEFRNLTEDEFDEMFELIENHLDDNASFDGCMFETYGEELEFVREKAKENRVITIVDGDNGNLFYTSGYHLVNRLGYLVTKEPLPDFEFEVELNIE